MDALTAAADELGLTVRALRAALDRGETIGSRAAACGSDVTAMTAAILDAEVSDIEALAPIAGFSDADIAVFVAELSAWLREYVEHGEAAADAIIDPRPLVGSMTSTKPASASGRHRRARRDPGRAEGLPVDGRTNRRYLVVSTTS